MISIEQRDSCYSVNFGTRCESYACRVRATLAAFREAKALAAQLCKPVMISVPYSFGDAIVVTS